MTAAPFSVVMSTYAGDRPNVLDEALASVLHQSLPPSEVILVLDGPIPDTLEGVVQRWLSSRPELQRVQLPENCGRGRARNAGIARTGYDIVFVADSDDRCHPDRFEVLMEVLARRPDIGLVAGWAQEFDDATGQILSVKRCPENHEDISRALRLTCVISNAACGFRKAWWEKVGGYPDYRDINEDYLFFLRLAKAGCKFYCLPRAVIDVRVNEEQRQRRRGRRVLMSDVRFRVQCLREGHNSALEAAVAVALYGLRRLVPLSVGVRLQMVWRRVAY